MVHYTVSDDEDYRISVTTDDNRHVLCENVMIACTGWLDPQACAKTFSFAFTVCGLCLGVFRHCTDPEHLVSTCPVSASSIGNGAEDIYGNPTREGNIVHSCGWHWVKVLHSLRVLGWGGCSGDQLAGVGLDNFRKVASSIT